MSKRSRHEIVTGESYDDHVSRKERREYRKERRAAGKEAAESAQTRREKRHERMKARADKALEQVAVKENLIISVKTLKKYKALKERFDQLKNEGNLNSHEGRQVRREYQRALRGLRQSYRRHIDAALDDKKAAIKSELLEEIGVLGEKKDKKIPESNQKEKITDSRKKQGEGETESDKKNGQAQSDIETKSTEGAETGVNNINNVETPSTKNREEEIRQEMDEAKAEREKGLSEEALAQKEAERKAAEAKADREKGLSEEALAQKEAERKAAEEAEEKAAREKTLNEKQEAAKPGFEALAAYKERQKGFIAKIDKNQTGELTFGFEKEDLSKTSKDLETKKTDIDDKIKDEAISLPNIQSDAKDLMSKIDAANKTLDQFEEVYQKTEKVYQEKMVPFEQKYKNVLENEAYDELLNIESTMSPDSPEEAALLEMATSIKKSTDEFSKVEGNSIEQQTDILKNLSENQIPKFEEELKIIEETLTLQSNVYEGYARYNTIDAQMKAHAKALKDRIQSTPSAWSTEGLLGKEEGFFNKASHFWDQFRDNVYHARLGSERSKFTPELNFQAEENFLNGFKTDLESLVKDYNQAQKPKERLEKLKAVEKKLKSVAADSQHIALSEKMGKAEKQLGIEGFEEKDSYTGMLAGLFGGDLDAIKQTDWAVQKKSMLGRSLAGGTQYLLGITKAAEDVVKWGTGMAIGVPGLVQTVPQVIGNGVQGNFRGVRAAMDNNTLTATATALAWDGVVKNGVGLVARLWPGDSNAVTKWAYADQGGTNHFNEGMGALTKGVWDWVRFWDKNNDKAGNGYQLGQMVGTGITMIGGGTAARVAASSIGKGARTLETAARGRITPTPVAPAPALSKTAQLKNAGFKATATASEKVAQIGEWGAKVQMPNLFPRLRITEAQPLGQMGNHIGEASTRIADLLTAGKMIEAAQGAKAFANQMADQLETIVNRMGKRNPDVSQAIQKAATEIRNAIKTNDAAEIMGKIRGTVIETPGATAGTTGILRFAQLADDIVATSAGTGSGVGGGVSRFLNRMPNQFKLPSATSIENRIAEAITNVDTLITATENAAARATAQTFAERLIDDLTAIRNRIPKQNKMNKAFDETIQKVQTELNGFKGTAIPDPKAFLDTVKNHVVTPIDPTTGAFISGTGGILEGITRYANTIDTMTSVYSSAGKVPQWARDTLNRKKPHSTLRELEGSSGQVEKIRQNVTRLADAGEVDIAVLTADMAADKILADLGEIASRIPKAPTLIRTPIEKAITDIKTALSAARGAGNPATLSKQLMTDIKTTIDSLQSVSTIADDLVRIEKLAGRSGSKINGAIEEIMKHQTFIETETTHLVAAGELDLAAEMAKAFGARAVAEFKGMIKTLGKRQPEGAKTLQRTTEEIEKLSIPHPPTAPQITDYIQKVKDAMKNPSAPVGAPVGTPTPAALTTFTDAIDATIASSTSPLEKIAQKTGSMLEKGSEKAVEYPKTSATVGFGTYKLGEVEKEGTPHKEALNR